MVYETLKTAISDLANVNVVGSNPITRFRGPVQWIGPCSFLDSCAPIVVSRVEIRHSPRNSLWSRNLDPGAGELVCEGWGIGLGPILPEGSR